MERDCLAVEYLLRLLVILVGRVKGQNHIDKEESVENVVSHLPVFVWLRKCDTIWNNQANNDKQKSYKHIPF